MRAPAYVGSDPIERATWLNLMAYCAEQENGGTIADCSDWKDRRWMQTCGVLKSEVSSECDLWKWDGENLVIWGYPKEKEAEVQAKREAGAKGGKSRAYNASQKQSGRTASSTASSTASTERNGKERNRNGIEKEAAPQLCASEGADEDFADTMPTVAAANMQEAEKRIQAIRPEWKLPFTYAERRSLMESAATIEEMTPDDWKTVRQWMHAKIDQSDPAKPPRSRIKFIEWLPDVYANAIRWHRKNKPSDAAKPKSGGWK